MNKLKVFIIAVGFLMCFVDKLKAVPVSDFAGLKDAIEVNDDTYDITLQSGVQYVWISSPTIVQAGILRGTSGDTFAILDGDNKYQAFKFSDIRYAILDGNFLSNKFKNNTSSGTVYANASSISFTNGNVLFTSNTNTTGGAVYSVNSKLIFSTITISFTSNTSVSIGAAIYAKGSNIDFTNASALFLKNKGAAIFTDSSNLNFINTNVNFTSNSAANGGAINSIGASRISFENGVDFLSNSAVSSGGAVFSKQSIVYFSRGVNFTSNTAKLGGAVYTDTLTNTDFVNATVRFVRNIALSSGGAILVIDPSAGLPEYASAINFTNSSILFSDNRAETGGGAAVYAGNNSKLNFSNSLANFTNNSAAGNGGAILADKSSINFTNTQSNFVNNNAKLGGAVYASNQTNIKFSQVNFTGNNAVSSGGAIFIKDSIVEIQSGLFSQNTANDKPNDIHLAGNSTLIFAPAAAQSIVLEGGITSEGADNIIRKRGDGDLLLIDQSVLAQATFSLSRIGAASAFIEFNGSFYIEEGKASLDISSGYVNSLSIGNGAALEIVLNWAAPDISFLYIDQLSVSPNSLLSLISLGDTVAIGSSKTFMQIGNIDRPDIFGSIYDSKYIYSFDWTQDENGAWSALAVIRALRINNVGLDGALYANLRTLAARSDFDFDFLGRQTDKKTSFWTAGSFVGGAIIRERKGDDEFEIGDFGYDGTGARLGWDFLSQGGIFFGYKHIDVHQGYDSWATGSDIEAGLYKIFDFRAAKLSFMTSYALQHFKAMGQTKVNGQAIRALGEAELGLFGSGRLRRGTSYQVSFFAQGRGAEIKSEKIYLKENADTIYEISAKDWIRLEILGGFKLEIKINELELMGKVYSGGATMGNRERFRWKQGERFGEIEASDEGDFFVGGALKAAYDLGKGVSLFTDVKIEKSVDAHNYGGDAGIRYKFSGFRSARRGSQVKVIGSGKNYEIQEGALDIAAQEGYADRNNDTAALIADALKERQQGNSNPSVAMVTLVYVSSGNPVAVERPQKEIITEPLEFELKQASAKEAQSVRNRSKKIFRLGNRSFGEDSTELTVKAKEEVRQLARQIKDSGFYRILVEGHTDDLTAGGNSLSSLRAQTVLIELRANGIPGNRLSFIDMGSSKPLVSNKTSAGRSNNRRVDIIVE